MRMVGKQMDAVFEDIEVEAVKIGMLSSAECMRAVAEKVRQYNPSNVLINPVMYAKNGGPLMEMTAIDTLIKEIIPLADVLTPNIPEAEKIAGMSIQTVEEMESAARKIHNLGCEAVKQAIIGGCTLVQLREEETHSADFYHLAKEILWNKAV